MPQTTNNLATLGEITAAIAAKGLPAVGKDAIAAISRYGRDEFRGSLSMLLSEKDIDGRHRQFLHKLLCCLTQEAQTSMQDIGLSPSLDELVQMALKKPVRLASAITAGHDPTHPSHAEAKKYLAKIFTPPSLPAMPLTSSTETPTQNPERGAPQQRNLSNNQLEKQCFRSAHVYGGNFALCFNASIDKEGRPGMMVDAAVSTGPRAYDWPNAIHIWLDEREIASTLAVFRHWRNEVEFKAHGQANDKSFSMEFQHPHYYCKVSASKLKDNNRVRSVKIMPLDANKVSLLFLEQLLRAYPNVPSKEVLEQVKICNTQMREGTHEH